MSAASNAIIFVKDALDCEHDQRKHYTNIQVEAKILKLPRKPRESRSATQRVPEIPGRGAELRVGARARIHELSEAWNLPPAHGCFGCVWSNSVVAEV